MSRPGLGPGGRASGDVAARDQVSIAVLHDRLTALIRNFATDSGERLIGSASRSLEPGPPRLDRKDVAGPDRVVHPDLIHPESTLDGHVPLRVHDDARAGGKSVQ